MYICLRRLPTCLYTVVTSFFFKFYFVKLFVGVSLMFMPTFTSIRLSKWEISVVSVISEPSSYTSCIALLSSQCTQTFKIKKNNHKYKTRSVLLRLCLMFNHVMLINKCINECLYQLMISLLESKQNSDRLKWIKILRRQKKANNKSLLNVNLTI